MKDKHTATLDRLERFLIANKEARKMDASNLIKRVVSDEYIGGSFDRFATFYSDGSLRISDTTLVENEEYPSRKDIELPNWDEVERLRTYLNKLEPPKGDKLDG